MSTTMVGLVTAGATLLAGQLGGQPATAEPTGDPALSAAIDSLLDDPRLDGTSVAVQVRDANTGEVLYGREADQRMLPASNLKLLSSAAAVDGLGRDHRFTTSVLATEAVHGGTLTSDLYLRGGGDPTTLAEDYRALAADLAASGLTRVTGNLVADDSYFDDVPLGTGWSWDDEPYYYSAPISALTVAPDTDYDSGTVIVRVTPGEAGEPAQVTMQPETDVLDVVNEATTGAAGTTRTLSVERQHASDTVVVSGSIPADSSPRNNWVAVPDPTAYAADVFARALKAEAIKLVGDVREGRTPEGATVLAGHDSMTVGELLTPYMKLSNNMHAETLVKALGAEAKGAGTWGAGLAAVREHLAAEGLDVADTRIVDGSGLSRMDLVRAQDITDLLIASRDEPWFDTWYESLPIAGNPDRFTGGTLRSRMRNTPAADNLHGKTGSLTGVTALSGYVSNADGRELVFAMISNNYINSPRSLEDALGVTLASWSEEGGGAEGGTVQRFGTRELRPSGGYGPDGVECSWVKAC
ncbi:MAG TPA: D-alanyl-D-alanine carboxypeptidase/D-alanyl-D-alanine-endopeptidase [Nocardioidaceae bacterium]|nr:D-alanyl-D-alanine carboxypeptidase/D-alanyl-D-alanine-endopeptidase [Nocardioidaceae bacterium]